MNVCVLRGGHGTKVPKELVCPVDQVHVYIVRILQECPRAASLRRGQQEPRQCGRQFRKDRNPGRSLKPGDHAPVCEPSLQDLQKAEMVSEED